MTENAGYATLVIEFVSGRRTEPDAGKNSVTKRVRMRESCRESRKVRGDAGTDAEDGF